MRQHGICLRCGTQFHEPDNGPPICPDCWKKGEGSAAVQRTMEKFNAELDRRTGPNAPADLSNVMTIDEARRTYAEDIEFARKKLGIIEEYHSRFWLAQLAANVATHVAGQYKEEIDRQKRTIDLMLRNATAIAEDVKELERASKQYEPTPKRRWELEL